MGRLRYEKYERKLACWLTTIPTINSHAVEISHMGAVETTALLHIMVGAAQYSICLFFIQIHSSICPTALHLVLLRPTILQAATRWPPQASNASALGASASSSKKQVVPEPVQ